MDKEEREREREREIFYSIRCFLNYFLFKNILK